MRPVVATAALASLLTSALLLTAGCGDGRLPESPPQASQFRDCTLHTFGSTGRPVATLHEAGAPVQVRLVPAGARHCPSSLITRPGSGVLGTSVVGLDLDAATARVVRTAGRDGQDLLAIGTRPGSGGSQTHLFTAGARELRSASGPLLPVPDPGRRTPVDATCPRDGGLAVVTAKPHRPPGIVLAWDVTRTTYLVHGDDVRETGSATVGTAVADPVLRKQHPELYDGRLLAGCG